MGSFWTAGQPRTGTLALDELLISARYVLSLYVTFTVAFEPNSWKATTASMSASENAHVLIKFYL